MPLGATKEWRNINDNTRSAATRMPYDCHMNVR
jgi:hypothetical protein